MTPTEQMLLGIHKAPAVQLQAITEHYLSLSWEAAMKQARTNRLPIPTFRMRDSRKAALLVKITDLAAYIDRKAEESRVQWEAAQV